MLLKYEKTKEYCILYQIASSEIIIWGLSYLPKFPKNLNIHDKNYKVIYKL